MIKRVFFIFIVLQVLFLGQCYASSDRLTDIGAEVFRERIKKICHMRMLLISSLKMKQKSLEKVLLWLVHMDMNFWYV